MKSQLSCILFALILPLSACGGDRSSTPTEVTPEHSSQVAKVPEPIVEPGKLDVPVGKPEVPSTGDVDNVGKVAMPETFDEHMELGKELAAKGDHVKAREMFEGAAKLDRKKAEPHIELARSYIATGSRALAIKSANKAVKLAPESSQAYNTLGRAELLRHDYEGAIEAFRQATELNEDNVWAWNNLGYTYLQLKRYQDAADALVEATTRPGTTGYMWNNLGTAYEHLDQLDDARVAFESGGKLGSKEALASRKRLEGVETIVVMRDEPKTEEVIDVGNVDEVDSEPVDSGYEIAEPIPEGVIDETTGEVKVDEEVEEDVEEDVDSDMVDEDASGDGGVDEAING